MSFKSFIIYFILIIIYFLCIYYINYFFIKIFILYDNKKINLYNDFEIIKFSFQNDTTNNIEYLNLLKEKEKLENEYKLLQTSDEELYEKYLNLINDYNYHENNNFILNQELKENQQILDELKEKIQYSIGDIERENYKNILLKTYNLEGIIYEYKKYFKTKISKQDILDYQKNLIKDYSLEGIIYEYKKYFKTKNNKQDILDYQKNLIKDYSLEGIIYEYKKYINQKK